MAGEDDPLALAASSHVAAVLAEAGRLEEAEPLLRAALATMAAASPASGMRSTRGRWATETRLSLLRSLALLLEDRGRRAEAEAARRECRVAMRAALQLCELVH